MGYNEQEEQDSGSGWYVLRSLGLMLTGGAVAAALLVAVGAWRVGDRFLAPFSHLFRVAQPAPKVDVQSVVIQQVRNASELTTAVFTMEAVVPTSQDSNIGGFVLGTTKLLYIAHGQVQAGVDLSQLTPENVQVGSDRIQIQLPPPTILDSKIDVSRSSVYDYNRGMLGLGPDVAPQLQALAQQEALKKIITAACSDGVLTKASDRAKLVVTQLLATTGYKAVAVEVQPPAPDACPMEGKEEKREGMENGG
ncbi:DUF4230 domain-containing protein [Kovacikia minuta CCNUW1]|uniref:DUF4230 domain-containing protein n=1 Tax=Kovacikia minuta TaxID=2931930 RepID=UPI001CC9A93B|nr:DUF4230 domain-containing protein [Kovacikia minuta]UBF26770.1 DUF4230 domain-containing protein [Kovacikia minuta CCNUW1]